LKAAANTSTARAMDKKHASEIKLTPRTVRRRLHISQTAIARAMGVTSGTVCQIESATDPRLSSLRRWAHAMGGEMALVLAFPRNDGAPVVVPLMIEGDASK